MLTGSTIAALTLAVTMGCTSEPVTPISVATISATSTSVPTISLTQMPTAAVTASASASLTATAAVSPTASSSPVVSPTVSGTPGVTVSPNDPAIEASSVSFTVGDVKLIGYLARPKTAVPHPAVLVIHENRGLLPHFEDVARGFAKEGYVALSLDLLSREGGTAAIGANASSALSSAGSARHVQDLSSAITYMAGLTYVNADRIGTMGFCFGGGLTWLMSVRNPNVKATAAFYGARPPLEEVPNMQAAALGIYASLDNNINSTKAELEAALKANNKTHKMVTYDGANHSFFNDTGTRYHVPSATAAWTETLAWFGKYLKGQ